MNLLALGALTIVGVAFVVAGAISLRRRAADRRLGALEAVDDGGGRTLRSERYRLVGRPDSLRRRRDGTWVPTELKHRTLPPSGPFRSHVVQVEAYCLLIEEETGRSPPFGVLRYADAELTVPWDRRARADLLGVLGAVAEPYDGRASPSPAKCRACPWSPTCDASAAAAPGRGSQ